VKGETAGGAAPLGASPAPAPGGPARRPGLGDWLINLEKPEV